MQRIVAIAVAVCVVIVAVLAFITHARKPAPRRPMEVQLAQPEVGPPTPVLATTTTTTTTTAEPAPPALKIVPDEQIAEDAAAVGMTTPEAAEETQPTN